MKIDIITADTGPLIHLAMTGNLDLLKKFGVPHIPDLVLMEADVPGKQGASEIKEWVLDGVRDGSVELAETVWGETLRLARVTQPDYRIKNGGELAILEWLISKVESSTLNALIIYENGAVPRMIQNYDSELSSVVMTTRSFLNLAEKCGHLANAHAEWQKMVDLFPTINSRSTVTHHGRLVGQELEP